MENDTYEQKMFEKFIQWGNQHDLVRAMLLTSSRAIIPQKTVDIFSDFDLILVTTDIIPFHKDRMWLEDFGKVLALYRDPIVDNNGIAQSGYVVQFEDGLKIDFTLWHVENLHRIVAQPKLPDEFDAGYRIILDKDNLNGGLQPPTYKAYIPTPPSDSDYQETIESFFLDTTYVAKFLWRDDLIAMKHLLDHIIKQDYLVPMLVWHSEIEHDWTLKPGLYGQRLKQHLRSDLWNAFESTYTGIDVDANWTALFNTVELFQKVATEVGEKLGYIYPADMDQRTCAYLRKVKNLD